MSNTKKLTREQLAKELKKFTKSEIIEICLKATFEDYTLYNCIEIMQADKKQAMNKKISKLLNEISKIESKLENTTDDKKLKLNLQLINKRSELSRTITKYCDSNKSKNKE